MSEDDVRARLRARLAARKAAEKEGAPARGGAEEQAEAPAPSAKKMSLRERIAARKKAAAGGGGAEEGAPAAAERVDAARAAKGGEAAAGSGKKLTARQRLAARLRQKRGVEGEGPSDAKARQTRLTVEKEEAPAPAQRVAPEPAAAPAKAAQPAKAAKPAEAARPAEAAEAAKAAQPAKAAKPEAARPGAAAKSAAAAKPRKPAKASKKPARPRPPAGPVELEPEELASLPGPPVFPRTHCPYVDDPVFERLPAGVRKLLSWAVEPDLGRPVRKVLNETFGPERERLEELLLGFVENQEGVLRGRFLPDDMEKYIWQAPSGDFTLRYGDGDVKVLASCWDYFFLFRDRRDLPADRVEAVQAAMAEVFQFVFEDTSVCPMKLDEPLELAPVHGAHYLRASLEVGAWCDMRFESGAAYTDGRVLVAKLQPRVVRGKDVPVRAPMSPKQFVQLLNSRRGR